MALAGDSPGTVPKIGGSSSSASEAKEESKNPDDADDADDADAKAPSGFADAFQGGADALEPSADRPAPTERAQSRAGTRAGNRAKAERETSDAGLGGEGASDSNFTAAAQKSASPALEKGSNGGNPNGGNPDGGNPNLDAEIEDCNSDHDRLRAMIEPIVSKPKCSDKLLTKPPFRFLHDLISAIVKSTGFAATGVIPEQMTDSSNVKEKSDKIEYLDKVMAHVGERLNTLVDARAAKIVAGLEAENTVRFLQLLVLAATNNTAGKSGGEGGEGEEGGGDAKEKSDDKEAERPAQAARVQSDQSEAKSSAEAASKQQQPERSAAAKSEPSPAPQQEESKGETGGGAATGGAAEPKSMRPTTARRRPPKVKENAAMVVKEAAPQAAKNTNIMKEGAGDDDFFNDDDDDEDGNPNGPDGGGDAKRVDVNDLANRKGGDRSKLVQKIIAEQEEENREKEGEAKVDDGKKGIRLGLNIQKSAGGAGLSSNDMEALLTAVQRLVTSTAPLGKCMDHVQEDLSQMSKEGEKWQTEYRNKIDALADARKQTEEELDPLRTTLRELDDQVKEQQEKVSGVKKSIFKNGERIRQLLQTVAGS